MNEVKHIAIGKIGKAVRFKVINQGTGEGDTVIFYSLVSRMNPNYKFYIIGPNDLDKLTQAEYDYIFPNHNVFSVHKRNKNVLEEYKCMYDYCESEGIHFDFGLFLLGLHSDKSIPNFLRKEDGSFYPLLNAFKSYAGPYVYMINKTGMPWYTVSEDARYITIHTKDILNYERMTFSQINGMFESHKHITCAENTIINNKLGPWSTHWVKAIYSHVEKIFLNGIDENWKDQIDIETKLNSPVDSHIIVLSNGCGTSQINFAGNNSSRYPMYKKWIIDNLAGTEYDGTMIYGSWDKEIHDKEPRIVNKLISDLKPEIAKAKYTLVYSQVPGFVTAKPREMIVIGVIPFLHPDYDCHHLLDLPEYLYVKDEQDFLNKVRELDANPEKYKALLNECIAAIKPEYLDGSLINNFIFSHIAEDMGFTYEKPEHGVKSLFRRFSKNMFDADKVNGVTTNN